MKFAKFLERVETKLEYHDRLQQMIDLLPSMLGVASDTIKVALRVREEVDFARRIYENAAPEALQVKAKYEGMSEDRDTTPTAEPYYSGTSAIGFDSAFELLTSSS
ncbi:hypothetical protein EG329_004530 [Mollisiaceae sp. DMI_Dod_QoI]|nr:hypothetical protein EG329_004530 [Helotiales sp. DMI_Dod_QoI]